MKVKCARGYNLDASRSTADCFGKQASALQSNADVPSGEVHIRNCKCQQAEFANVISGFSNAITDYSNPGTGCVNYCMLCTMLVDYQAELG